MIDTKILLYTLPLVPLVLYFCYVQFWAMRVSSEAHKKTTSQTADEIAKKLLDTAGVQHVIIEKGENFSENIYDPAEKKIFLSPNIFGKKDVSSVGIAAHAVGHAILDSRNNSMLKIRKLTVPIYTILYWSVFCVIPIGVIMGSIPTIIVGYVLTVGAIILNSFHSAIHSQVNKTAEEQLQTVGLLEEAGGKELRKMLKAISLQG